MKVLLARTLFQIGLALILCSAVVYSQTATKRLEKATKFDEYGSIGGCDHSARLDNLAITLQEDPTIEGHIVYYGHELAGQHTLEAIKDYLVNSRGISEDRFHVTYGGANDDLREPRVQLWLAPNGIGPELTRYENKFETFTGLFEDGERSDNIDWGEADGGTGPPVYGGSILSFVDMLNKRKETVAFIVAFNGADAAPGAWRRVAQLESERLQSSGIAGERIKTLYGGSRKETSIQLWILPTTEPPPVKNVDAEPLPDKTIQIGSFGDNQLGEERSERWALEGLLDVLRSSKDLRACIIVKLEKEVAAEELDQEQPPQIDLDAMPETPGPKPADLLKLVEKWKSELVERHKVSHDRIVVLFTRAKEYEGNTLETWIVPSGASLPDPDAEPAEETVQDPQLVQAVTEKDGIQSEVINPDKFRSNDPQPDKAQRAKKNPPQL